METMMETDDQRTKSPTRTTSSAASTRSGTPEAGNQEVKDPPSLKKGTANTVTPVHNIKPIISITPVLSSPSAGVQCGKSSPIPCIAVDCNSPSLSSANSGNPLSLLAHVSSNSGGSSKSRKTSPMVASTLSTNCGISTPSSLSSSGSSCQAIPIALTTKNPSSPLCLVTNGKAPTAQGGSQLPSTVERSNNCSESDSHTGASSDASVCSDLSHESGDENRDKPARPGEASITVVAPNKHNSSKSLAENIEKLHQKHQEHTLRYNLDGKVNMGFPIGLSSSITLTPVAPPSPPLSAPLNLSMKPVAATPNSGLGGGLSGLNSIYNNVLSLVQQTPAQNPYKGAKRGPKPKHLKAAMLEGVNHLRQRQEELAHLEAQIKVHEMQRMLGQQGPMSFMNHQLTPPRIHIQTSVGRGKSVVITTTSPSSSHSESPNSRRQHHHNHHSPNASASSKSRSVSLLAGSKLQEMPSTSVNAQPAHQSRARTHHSRKLLESGEALGNGMAAARSLVGSEDGSEYRSHSTSDDYRGSGEDKDKAVARFKASEATESDEDESLDDESSGETADSSSGSESSGGESEASTSDTERSRETTSSTSKGKKRDYSSDSTPSRKRRKYIVSDERELRIPLEYGWRRLTKIRTYSFSGVRGEVVYFGPCGKKLKTYPEVVRYLEKNGMNDITRENFTFSSKHNVGEFLEPQGNGEYLNICEADVIGRIEEFRVHKGRRYAPMSQRRLDKKRHHAAEKMRKKEEARLQRKLEEQAAEARRQKEHLRFLRQQERIERQEQQRVDKESKAQQVFEARKKRQELLEKQRVEENEREMKRLQAVVLREQELQKRREMLIMVDLERERRRQHMLLVKALEARKRQEERERMKEERIVEKKLNRERKLEQRRMEMHMIREMKKPVEDMELSDAQQLPTLNRMPGVKLSGKAFADILMVFEFLHNFGETLGFDMVSLPTLNTLQMALLNDEGCEEELLSVLHHLLICAIDDPGLPQGIKGATAVGQALKEVDITGSTVSEILRIYIHANEGEKCKMLDWIAQKPFIALTPTQKAAIVAYLCNELLCSRNICRQIDNNIETVNSMRRDKWVAEGKVRQLKTLQAKKIAHRELKMQMKEERQQVGKSLVSQEGKSGGSSPGERREAAKERERNEDNEDVRNDSGNESEESHNTMQGEAYQDTDEPEEDVPGESVEDLAKKIDRCTKQQNLFRRKLLKASQQLRAISLGQDRYRRRYWLIPHGGGVFVEGMESAELQEDHGQESAKTDQEESEEEQQPGVKDETGDGSRECKMEVDAAEEGKGDEAKDLKPPPDLAGDDASVVSSLDVKIKTEGGEDAPWQEGVSGEAGDALLVPKLERAEESESATDDKNRPTDSKRGPSPPAVAEAKAKTAGGDVPKSETCRGERDPRDKTPDEDAAAVAAVNLAKRHPEGGFASVSGLFPTIPQYQVCAEQILRTLTERHGHYQQQQQPWFSLLPRMPCDETSLTRLQSAASPAATPTSKSQSCDAPSPSVFSSTPMTAAARHLSQYNPFYFHGSPVVMGLDNGSSPFPYLMPPPPPLPHYMGGSPAFGSCGNGGGGDFGSPYHLARSSYGSYCSYGFASPIDPALLEQYAKHQQEQQQPQEAKPIPVELQKGWWRITDGNQLRAVAQALHPRGIREKMLHLKLQKYLDIACDACGKAGHSIIDLDITDMDREISQKPGGAPEADRECDWNRPMALRADMAILEQVENMEEKIASASMQIKGWKLPMKITDDDGIQFYPSCEPIPKETQEDPENPSKQWLCPLTTARQRLLDLEENIERRYIKPPLGYSTGQVNIHSMSGNSAENNASANVDVVNDEENGDAASEESPPSPQRAEVPEGLLRWRAAVQKTRTSSQLAVCLNFLEGCIAWDRSIMKASCQFCNSGDNEAMLLLCDGCDKGYHTYCFKPKMETIPEGDWFCFECRNKATGDRMCLFCGKKGKNICSCDNCPKAFHLECMEPPMSRLPKGRWLCQHCSQKSSKGKGKNRKSKDPKDVVSEAEDAAQAKKGEKAAKLEKAKDRSKMPVSKDLESCRVVLAELETHEDAWPFLLPVNTKQFPSYRKVIKKPMDLSTIRSRLENGSYKSRGDFLTNVRLMFDNCETFNEDDSPVGKAGHNLRAYFESRWFDVEDK